MQTKAHPGTWIVEAMERGGVDVNRLADRLPREFEQLLHSIHTASPDDVLALLEECVAISGDANFGLHMAKHLELTRIGTYGYLLLNAPTIREFLELAARYYPLIYQGGRLELSVSDRTTRFSYRIVKPLRLDPRHIHEWTIGYFANFIRTRLDQPWHPHRTVFAHPAPEKLDELRDWFGDNVKFDAEWSGIEFGSDILDAPITEANPVLLRIISHHADDLIQALGKKDPFRTRVRLLIMEGLEKGESKAEIVAHKLNMSLSSFKRQMRDERLDFRELRDGIIRDLSQRALTETSLPLADIALKMGYSEMSAFTRAFTRVSGKPPLEYRRSTARREALREQAHARRNRSPLPPR